MYANWSLHDKSDGIPELNEVIISSAEGINKLSNVKPKDHAQTPIPCKQVQRKLSQEEIRTLAKLKHMYVYQYCANEYLKSYGEFTYSAQNEYD